MRHESHNLRYIDQCASAFCHESVVEAAGLTVANLWLLVNNRLAKLFVAALRRLSGILSYDTNVQPLPVNPQSDRDEAKQGRMRMDRHFSCLCMVFH
jgi:hypothetical protein